MLYNYLNNLDKQLNETLTLYKNLARLSKPLIQYIIFIISLLVFTCCFILLFYCLTNTNVINNELTNNTINDNLFVNIILPIILYGLLCPILSTIIGSIFKIFFDTLIQKIKTKHLYIKHIIKDNNIINYILFHKINIIYPILYIFIYNYDNLVTYLYILIYLCIQLNRILIFYTNTIDCKIISIEKCYNNNTNYWNFELEIDTNHKKKIINKRFNDFKKLSNNYNYNNIKLPTSSWLFTPNNINDATKRAVELNKYIKNITNDETLLQNSVFFNFINSNNIENKIEENNIVLEKTYLEQSDYLNVYNNIEKLKTNCQKLISMSINEIFIVNEINYYNCLKKRIIVLTNNSLIKIKYYITQNIFKIRLIIDFKNINYIEYGKITNTNTLNNKYILNIFFNKTFNIILSSLDTNYYYSVKSLIKILDEKKIQVNYVDNIKLNNGLGISEYILNNNVTNYLKNMYYNTYLQFNI